MALAYLVGMVIPALALREARPVPAGLPPAPAAELAVSPGHLAGEMARDAHLGERELSRRGFAVFQQALPGKVGANVVGILPGKSEAVILLVAPFDPADPAANRAAAAVLAAVGTMAGKATATLGVLLEGAHTHAHEGARVFARTFAGKARTLAALGIGPLPVDGPCFPRVGAAGQPAGYSPLWLRRTMLAIAAAQGEPLADMTGPGEWFARAASRTTGPHGPLLAARVPSITYECGWTGYASPNMPSPSHDAVFRAASLALRFVRTLDQADLPAQEPRGLVTVAGDAAIFEERAGAASAMAFLPLWMATALAFARAGRKPGAIRRAIGAFAVRIAPLGAALLALWALPRWGGWPADPPAPALPLPLPPWQPLLWVLLAFCGTWLALRPLRAFFLALAAQVGQADRVAYRRSLIPAELLALALACAFALAVNPFSATTLLLPAAWLWPLAIGGPGSALLTLLGGTGVMTIAVGAGAVTGLDWRIAPYFLETLAAGGWTPAAALAGVLVVGAGAGGLARSLR